MRRRAKPLRPPPVPSAAKPHLRRSSRRTFARRPLPPRRQALHACRRHPPAVLLSDLRRAPPQLDLRRRCTSARLTPATPYTQPGELPPPPRSGRRRRGVALELRRRSKHKSTSSAVLARRRRTTSVSSDSSRCGGPNDTPAHRRRRQNRRRARWVRRRA